MNRYVNIIPIKKFLLKNIKGIIDSILYDFFNN